MRERIGLQRRKKTFTSLAIVAAAASAAAVLGPSPVALAATASVVSAADVPALARQVNAGAYPSGSVTAVVTTQTNTAVLAQAGSYAAAIRVPLVVAADGAASSAVVSDLSSLGSSTALLFGSTSTFDPTFVTDLSARVTVDTSLVIDTAYDRSAALVAKLHPSREVVTDVDDPTNIRLATSLAGMKGDPLILLDGTETPDQLKAMFPVGGSTAATVVGANLPGFDSLDEASQSSSVGNLPTDDPVDAEIGILDQAVGRGAKANDMFIAPSDQVGSFVLTVTAARAANAVAMTAGPAATITASSAASSDLKLWGPETSNVRLFGLNVTTAQANALATPTTVKRAAAPGWRVLDATVTSSNWTLKWNAALNGKTYKVYDILGKQLGSTTALQLTIPGAVQSVSVAALDSAGKEFARFEYAVNDYPDTASRASAVIGSDRKGGTFIQMLGGPKVPHIITRTTVDPFDATKAPVSTQVAITCSSWFAEAGLDATKEYDYDVTSEGNSANRACDATAPIDAADPSTIQSSAVALPSTEYPPLPGAAAKSSATVRTQSKAAALSAASDHAAIPTVAQFQIMQATGVASKGVAPEVATLRAASQGQTAKQAASTAATNINERIRYQGFIPEKYVLFPTKSTHDPSRGWYAFGGNGHGVGNVNGSYKFREDLLFDFNAKKVSEVSDTGTTHGYKCKKNYMDCVEIEQAKADPASAAVIAGQRWISSTAVIAEVKVHTKIPLAVYAPAIDADLNFMLSPGHSGVVGTHDGMPVHEYYTAAQYPNSDYTYSLRYYSKTHWLPCLYGSLIPGCATRVNRNL